MNNKKSIFSLLAFALGFVTLGLNAGERGESSIRRALSPLRETLIPGARPGATTEEMTATTTAAETTPMTTTTSSELTTAPDASERERSRVDFIDQERRRRGLRSLYY